VAVAIQASETIKQGAFLFLPLLSGSEAPPTAGEAGSPSVAWMAAWLSLQETARTVSTSAHWSREPPSPNFACWSPQPILPDTYYSPAAETVIA
jgi:hypothetical protein